MKTKLITLKATPETLDMLRFLAGVTHEYQYAILERLVRNEVHVVYAMTFPSLKKKGIRLPHFLALLLLTVSLFLTSCSDASRMAWANTLYNAADRLEHSTTCTTTTTRVRGGYQSSTYCY